MDSRALRSVDCAEGPLEHDIEAGVALGEDANGVASPYALGYVSLLVARAAHIALLVLFLLWMGVGCGACSSESSTETHASTATPEWTTAVSLLDELPSCEIDHRGLLVDLGTEVLRGRLTYQLDEPEGIVSSEHDGATWARVFDKTLTLSFHLQEVTPIFVAMRAIGGDATSVSVSLDAVTLGTIKLKKGEIRIGETRITKLPVEAGMHRLTLVFHGRKRTDSEPFAELDWIRVGFPDELERTYGAPTFDDLLAPAAQLASVPHRALSMRAPGNVRCTIRVPTGARLRAAVGMNGDGHGTAAILVREEGSDPVVLDRIDVKGGPAATWSDIELSLQAYAGKIVSLELAATETTGTGRLLVGDPVVETPLRPLPSAQRAKAAVVVVVDGVERSDLPPWREAKSPHLPTFNRLAEEMTVFHDHRAPSTFVSAVMASLLSGLSPRHHTVNDSGAALPPEVRTISGIAREASVTARMFTGVPTTFGPFGFDGQWDQFQQYPPNEGRLASAPMDDAGEWLENGGGDEGRPMLAVIHARGGHPPWEVTPVEADKLPPADYAGYLTPRRSAQLLAKTEGRHSRLSDADRERMRALFHAGLSRQDEALGRLIRRLEDKGLWDDTLFIVTGDVASARRSLFVDGGDPTESLLTLPLFVHFPGGKHAGVRVDDETEIYDITRTVLAALGLKAPEDTLGNDLLLVAGGLPGDRQRVRVAFTHDKYSARWGDFALHGEVGKPPALCRLSIDPTCAYDRTHQFPGLTQALFKRLVRFQQQRKVSVERARLRLTPDQSAWLDVWGSYYQNL